MIRCIILTISDSSNAGTREDRSGPALKARCEEMGWQVLRIDVLPDEAAKIQTTLWSIADGHAADLVLTTGGTGAAPRDVTPEAVRAVLEKEIPGLGELMRAEGLKHTPLAALSRSLGGTLKSTLIVALPGSPKGATESLNAIVNLVPHVIDLVNGKTGH